MLKEDVPKPEPWEEEIIEEAKSLKYHQVEPIPLSKATISQGFSISPLNGTIFTAMLPDSARGGSSSDLLLIPKRNIFPDYRVHAVLDSSEFFRDKRIIKNLNPRDSARFVIWDEDLETAHSLGERNWVFARFLRPLYIHSPLSELVPERDSSEQIIVEPEGFESLLVSALSKHHVPEGTKPTIYNPTIRNDLTQLTSLPRGTLERAYQVYKKLRTKE